MGRSFEKKLGFTLIELLAVIVILAVIALIATPLVLNIIERAEKGAFKDSVYGIMEAAEFQVILDGSKYPITFVYPLDSDKIKFKGTKPSEGYLQIVSEGKMKLALGNGRWCAVKDVNDSQVTIIDGKCEKTDFNRPIISGYGDLNQTIPVNGSYTMPNVTATDKDGNKLNITTTIKQGDNTVDKIDTSKEGTFTIIYTTEPDKDGNTATVTVTVTVQKPKSAATTLIEKSETDADLEFIDDTYYYRGSSPKNYVQFNDELWRIISVKDEQLKIIRSESIGNMVWNGNNSSNDWTTATLNTHLNGTYYATIKNGQNKIAETSFFIGTVNKVASITASDIKKNDETKILWSGKIGLMNVSDYAYASKEEDANSNSCIQKAIENVNCKNHNWLYSGQTEWTMNALAQDPYRVFAIRSDGDVYGAGDLFSAYRSYAVRPVVYLKSEVTIVSGNGTADNPYIIQ